MRAAVLTALYGDRYDDLKPALPQEGAEVEWVVVTDDYDLLTAGPSLGWKVVYEPRDGVHPNRAAKRPKMLPGEYTAADASVWVDASFLVTSPTFVVDALKYADPIAQFDHPWRSCLYDEAQASAGLPKYTREPVLEQAAYYRTRGMPEQFGLWATGVIARRHAPVLWALGAGWVHECNRWSFQDQVSEPYILWALDLRPALLPGTHMDNAWLAYQGSVRHG